ncbi:MAG: single-stranded DNA-binding protein [Eubacterium sp.]|nr:single-stranded DNA-binding protein [Eubacterium sp.]
MNKVILVGRLTRDPDIRYSNGENATQIARYTLAVDRRRRSGNQGGNEQEADFIGCVAFGKSAEFAEKYLHKGTKIGITGRIQTGRYTNRDGQTVYTTDVIVEDQEFMESKAAASRGEAQFNNSQNFRNAQEAPSSIDAGNGPDANVNPDDFMNIPEMDSSRIPF